MDVNTAITNAISAMSWWEVAAVFLGVAYLLLAMAEKVSCWYAAFISTTIYTFLFWDVNLLMDSALQIYYMAMAVYGWWQWTHSSNANESSLAITSWPVKFHLCAIAAIVILSLCSGYLLNEYTAASWAYLDSFTTWGAVITTYMVAKKVLENWYYWLVIDAVAAYLYLDKELYLTALLFGVYVIIVVFGLIAWRKTYQEEQAV